MSLRQLILNKDQRSDIQFLTTLTSDDSFETVYYQKDEFHEGLAFTTVDNPEYPSLRLWEFDFHYPSMDEMNDIVPGNPVVIISDTTCMELDFQKETRIYIVKTENEKPIVYQIEIDSLIIITNHNDYSSRIVTDEDTVRSFIEALDDSNQESTVNKMYRFLELLISCAKKESIKGNYWLFNNKDKQIFIQHLLHTDPYRWIKNQSKRKLYDTFML